MAARPVFADLDNVPLPDPTLATLHRAEQDLPATTAYPPTADELAKARQVASDYRYVAEIYKPDSPEFKQNQSAAELYAVAVENLAAAQYLTPTPGEGEGQVAVPAPAQPGPTYLAMQAAGIGGPFLILASAIDGVKEDVQGVKDDLQGVKQDVKMIKRDLELVKRRQRDLKGDASSLKAQSAKTSKRVRSVKNRVVRLLGTNYTSEAQRQRATNASLRTVPGNPLVVVPGPDGRAPPRAITTWAQINALTGPQLNELLTFYHLPIDHLLAERRNRLQAYLCGETLAAEPTPYPQDELEADEEGIWDPDVEEEEDEALWDDEEQERLWRAEDEAAAAGEGPGGEA
ncbi:hypothetical protein JCM10296v2_005456 [Rhodotorula toruloides]